MAMTDEDVAIANSDWRPLISYTANLASIGHHMLGTHEAYESLSQFIPPANRAAFVVTAIGPQFPISWSIYVLSALLIVSICILNFRIKSLDRLK